jgi:UDP-N-acetylmuramoyl-L-alanyl-D-glutamate--2,6-diaminopimelate ligase
MAQFVNKLKSIVRKATPDFLISFYHLSLAFLGALMYGFPSRKVKVIGITGTNGKSTVVEMIHSILTKAGFKAAAFSSISFKIGRDEHENILKMTMPGRFKLQRLIRQAVDAGCKYAVLEVTSEGIKQHRHRFINFETAVFTNLSPEHIEAHGSFENYRKAKEKLFEITKNTHILNLDDRNIEHFAKHKSEKKYGYSVSVTTRDGINTRKVLATNYKSSAKGIEFWVNQVKFEFDLIGVFNIHNALSAICVALSEKIDLEICSIALSEIETIPGRMEVVISGPVAVIVDYAFTPNALEKAYKTMLEIRNKKQEASKLICVLGAAGGGRDKWKRPILGQLADKYCNKIIVTNEDPYDEDPMKIINKVAEGAGQKAEKILDRREAIKKALYYAKPGDGVIITGKGSEPWICVAHNKKIPWDDRKVVLEEAQKLNKNGRQSL